MASMVARAYSGGLGAMPSVGSGGKAESNLKIK